MYSLVLFSVFIVCCFGVDPPECSSYTTLLSDDRLTSASGGFTCDSGFGSGSDGVDNWHRFTLADGNNAVIPMSVVPIQSCGTQATGYIASVSENMATICYHWNGNTCQWTNTIPFTECSGGFTVYDLSHTPICTARYCVEVDPPDCSAITLCDEVTSVTGDHGDVVCGGPWNAPVSYTCTANTWVAGSSCVCPTVAPTAEHTVALSSGGCDTTQTAGGWSWSCLAGGTVGTFTAAQVCVGNCIRTTLPGATGGVSVAMFAIGSPGTLDGHKASIEGRTPIVAGGDWTIQLVSHSGSIADNGLCSGAARTVLHSLNVGSDVAFQLFAADVGTETCWQVMVIDNQPDGRRRGSGGDFHWDDIAFGDSMVVAGDPHFTPLNGDAVFYTPVGPVTPAVYNILTHSEMQWNTLWVKKTTWDQLVVRASFMIYEPILKKETRVYIELNKQNQLNVTVNNEVIPQTTQLFTQSSKDYYVVLPSLKSNVVEIQTPLINIKYSVSHTGTDFYLDSSVRLGDSEKIRHAHGILGQTARTTVPYRLPTAQEKSRKLLGCVECYVEGKVGDYIVANLWSSDFKYNEYKNN